MRAGAARAEEFEALATTLRDAVRPLPVRVAR